MTIPELFGPNVAIARIILSNRVNEGEYEIAKATVTFRLTVPYGAHLNAPLFAHLKGTFHSQGVLVMQ